MAYQTWLNDEAAPGEMRDALDRFLKGSAEARASLEAMVRRERSLDSFIRQCKEVCVTLAPEAREWQENLVEFLGDGLGVPPSYHQLGLVLPLLRPKYQVELLLYSLDPSMYIDSDHLASVFCRCCLYGLKYLSRSCLLRNRSRLISACRALGPSWDASVGLCFAAELPTTLLNDEEFVRSGLACVKDEGHSLQWLSCMSARMGRRRDVALAFVQRHPCVLQHTEYSDDEEMALEALKHSVKAVDCLSVRLRRKRSVLEAAASCGASFFFTETGRALRADRELVLLAAAGSCSDLVPLLPSTVARSLRSDPGVLAAVVHGLVSKAEREEEVRQILRTEETRQDAFYQELLKKPGCFQLLDAPLRARRDLVLLAAQVDASVLTFAEPAVWASDDEGLDDFVFSLLSAGCPRGAVPAEVWSKLGEGSEPIGLAAAILQKNRDLWGDLPQSTQEALRDCFDHRCSICFQLPNEIRTCAPANGNNCRNYFCRPCLETMAGRSQGRVTCPTCRLPQASGRSCGVRAWAAETLVERELAQVAAKRRRLRE